MNQSKGLSGELKPEDKKTTNMTTMGPTTDIDSHAPTNLLKQIEWGAVILSEDRLTVCN